MDVVIVSPIVYLFARYCFPFTYVASDLH